MAARKALDRPRLKNKLQKQEVQKKKKRKRVLANKQQVIYGYL